MRKAPSAHDARGVVLTLTPRGRRVWSRVMALIADRNEAFFSGLSASEQRQFARLVDRLLVHAQGDD